MYITCEQCSTIYRLDETLLKPSGSRVRCSQCRFVFVAEPPEGALVEIDQPEIAPETVDQYQDTFDQELEGIDVAELDSILEQGRATDAGAALISGIDSDEDEEPFEFNEADLDMDFEAAFDQEVDAPDAADAAAETSVQAPKPELEDLSDEIDLDMDFEWLLTKLEIRNCSWYFSQCVMMVKSRFGKLKLASRLAACLSVFR